MQVPNPIQRPELGYVANLLLNHPGLDKKVRDEGFDARLANQSLASNPYSQDGCYTWWREGWFNADDNLRYDPLPEEESE